MYDYVNYYEPYITDHKNAKKAFNDVINHSVLNNVVIELEDAITKMETIVNSSLLTETSDETASSLVNVVNDSIMSLQNIKDFLSSDYSMAEVVYLNLLTALDSLKENNEYLEVTCKERPNKDSSKYYDSYWNEEEQREKKRYNSDRYNKDSRIWENKVLDLKTKCKYLKKLVDDYLSYLDKINNCLAIDGTSGVSIPELNVDFTKYTPVQESQVSPSAESIEYHTYQYQISPTKSTTVYYTIIPKNLQPNLAIATDSKGNIAKKLPWEFADEVGAKYAINFSLFGGGRNEPGKRDGGAGISYDGEHLFIGQHYNCDTTLYMDEDGNLGYIDNKLFKTKEDVAPTLKEMNVKWAAKGFYPIIDEYEYVNNNTDYNIGGDSIRHPRTFFGQLDNGDYIMGVCSGRNNNDNGEYENGMTLKEVGDFVQNYATDNEGNKIRVRFLMNGDGGGSSAFVADGEKKNVSGEDRPTTDIIYVGGVQV